MLCHKSHQTTKCIVFDNIINSHWCLTHDWEPIIKTCAPARYTHILLPHQPLCLCNEKYIIYFIWRPTRHAHTRCVFPLNQPFAGGFSSNFHDPRWVYAKNDRVTCSVWSHSAGINGQSEDWWTAGWVAKCAVGDVRSAD